MHALIGHDNGGALVIVEEDPDIYSPLYCRGPETPDNNYCGKIDVLRFDDSATQQWRTTITTKQNVNTAGAGPYVWWYQHTMRLGFENNEYAVFFRAAGSSERPGEPGEVDIHTGDRMHFVSADGVWLEDRGGFCGHSWAIRMAYNGRWAIACHGDGGPQALRLSVYDHGGGIDTALFGDGSDPVGRALGGLVARDDGFWLNHIQTGSGALELRLSRVDSSAAIVQDDLIPQAVNLKSPYPFRAYMERYSLDQLLMGYKQGEELMLMTADFASGAVVDTPVSAGANIDNWIDWTSVPNGDVVWAYANGRSSDIDIVRVRACE